MTLPHVVESDVRKLFPTLVDVGTPFRGGQKLVFPCFDGRNRFALKILRVSRAGHTDDEDHAVEHLGDEVMARARREVDILRQCTSEHLPRLGPIDLHEFELHNQRLAIFSEEWIDGSNLIAWMKNNGPLSAFDLATLGIHITLAIEQLWSFKKLHRDIKPGNIMRSGQGRYVLLDPGIAFDLLDASLTADGLIPHTPGSIAPELLDARRKRDADFRADLFLLGIVLYLAATRRHPFVLPGIPYNSDSVIRLIPDDPRILRHDIPESLSSIIIRLLAKKPHARFRDCRSLIEKLSTCLEDQQ